MPSIARKHQLAGSLLYHIFNRGNARNEIFHDAQDYDYFVGLAAKYSAMRGFSIYHWALMPNHYHLLMEIAEPENISSIMSGLAGSYVYYYHRKYDSAGHIWQGRFKSQPIQKESYLLSCGRYIERNPVKAGMAALAEEYPYSSALYYTSGKSGKRDPLTTEDPLFVTFAEDLSARRREYKLFLEKFDSEEERMFENMERPLGSKEFLAKLINEKGLYLPRRRGKPRKELVCKIL